MRGSGLEGNLDDLKRREFLKLGGAAVVAGATPLSAAAARLVASAPAASAELLSLRKSRRSMTGVSYARVAGQA